MDGLKIIFDFLNNDFNLKKKKIFIFGKVHPFFLLNFFRDFFKIKKSEIKICSFLKEQENIFFESEFESDNLDIFSKKIFFFDFTEKNFEKNIFNKNISLIIYSEKDIIFKNKSVEKIDIDNFVNTDSLLYIYKYLDEREKLYSQILIKKFNKLKIEKFFYLLLYSKFLKVKNWDELFLNHNEEINKEKNSLFDLTTSFFKKDEKNFYFFWNLFKNDYEVEFWNSYWLKQFWQAFKFLKLDNELSIKYNLPFWFIKNGNKIYNKELFLEILKELYLEISFFRESNFDFTNIFPCEKIFFFWFMKK